MSGSRSQGQNIWYWRKEPVTRNTHVKYESPISNGSKGVVKVKVFNNVGQRSRSRSQGQKVWYWWKGLVTRNTHVKYEIPFSYGSKVMIKLWCHRQRDGYTDRPKTICPRNYVSGDIKVDNCFARWMHKLSYNIKIITFQYIIRDT